MRFPLMVVWMVGVAWAQEAPPEAPAMPAPSEDFRSDQKQFEEVVTEPERQRDREERAREALVKDAAPLYTRMPAVDWAAEAAAGVFAAGIVGLVGGAIGEAIDPGRETQPLGGFHGPVFGGIPGAGIGATLGVWGAAQLVDKETHVGWTALGAGIGTAVGSGAALGIGAGLGDSDTTTTLSVGVLLLAQVGLAMVFTDVFAPPPGVVRADRVTVSPSGP